MEKRPTVSIVTPVYNAAKFLDETIQSVVSQTFSSWELILVVDRKSSDASLDIAKSWSLKDPRILVISNESCLDVSKNRNEGISRSRGEYISFLDADDTWLPQKLAVQVEFMRKHNFRFTFHSYERMDEQGMFLSKTLVPRRVTYKDILKVNNIGCLAVMIDSGLIARHRFESRNHEDYCLWLDLLKEQGVEAYGLQEVLGRYRIVSGSRSSHKMKAASWRWDIVYHREKLPFWRAVYYFTVYAVAALTKRL